MAEEKSLWQRIAEGVKRVWNFPERLKEKGDAIIQDAVYKPSPIDEMAKEAKFFSQFPYPYGWFLHTFQPDNEKEKAVFEYMKGQLKEGNLTLEAYSGDLAKIGNAPVLQDLWKKHQESQDIGVRKSIIENPKCPAWILEAALSDKDWEVRKSAVLRPEITQDILSYVAQREMNPMVQDALKERLGNLYITKSKPALDSVIKSATARAGSVSTQEYTKTPIRDTGMEH